jgi:hypothetical protein
MGEHAGEITAAAIIERLVDEGYERVAEMTAQFRR